MVWLHGVRSEIYVLTIQISRTLSRLCPGQVTLISFQEKKLDAIQRKTCRRGLQLCCLGLGLERSAKSTHGAWSMVSSMEVLSFPSKYIVILQSLPNQGWTKALATFWTERRNAWSEETRECTGESPLPLWDYITSYLGVQLQGWGKICVAQQISVWSLKRKTKGKLWVFHLSPVSALCHEIKIPKRQFSALFFDCRSKMYIFWGISEKYMQKYFYYIYS